MLGRNVLRMLSLNICGMFLEKVMLPFRRTFWEQKENFLLKTLIAHCMVIFSKLFQNKTFLAGLLGHCYVIPGGC